MIGFNQIEFFDHTGCNVVLPPLQERPLNNLVSSDPSFRFKRIEFSDSTGSSSMIARGAVVSAWGRKLLI